MISKKDVQYIAHLARISLSENEQETLAKDLEGIVKYVGKLQELDTKAVEPTTHVLPINNVFREDVVRPSLTQEEALANAPAKEAGSFKVPQVIE
ncbi:MAG: Asp-tRNA(Asn)/Glu-tRNA(Gln) amidotransferase subunit GatC [Candidatus Omnitrophica bacterium]|nr:Asp-tRNA(Asn)/Glu-tRNA(Gln) amidotransferase subunit GatC [Candidatus Omnitrophota bacterium]